MIYPSRLYPAYKPFGVPWLCREHWEVRKPRNIWAEATERYKPDWSLLSIHIDDGPPPAMYVGIKFVVL